MESAEDRDSLRYPQPPDPVHSQDALTENCSTSGEGTSTCVEHITPEEQQDVEQHLPSGGCLKEEILEVTIGSYDHEGSLHTSPDVDCIKEEELKDDDYLYCEECKSFFFNKCEVHGPAVFILDTPIPMGVDDRARQTLPPGLEVQISGIPDAGLGVFNNGETVPVGAHFGPYQGEPVDREEAINSGYSWVICKSRQREEYIDAKREMYANWLRYVNCACDVEEQNLVAFQYQGAIFYRCCRPIKPGQELLVWYDEDYAKDLSIMFNYLWNKKCSGNENIPVTCTVAPKRRKTSASDSGSKRHRRSIDLEVKQKVIKQHEGGKSVNAIARDLGMSHSTISTILKNKVKILQAVKGSAPLKATRLLRTREGPISDMEKLLKTWIEDQTQKLIPLSTLMISAKARSLFEMLKEKAGPDYNIEFSASSGWFKRFKQRFSLHNVKLSGESASADAKAAEEFVETLDKLIVQGGYLPQQIFNMDETSLFWKRMPERTFIHKEAKSMPGFKAFKDKVTVLLGGNVAGHKLKPFVIWRRENPRAFKNVNIHSLPVFYRSSKRSWMTQLLFQDALLNCYASEMEKYCLEAGISFKILVIVDSAPGHPHFIGDLHPNIKVVFLPPNTTSLIQPMDQGIISAFKAYYLRRTFAQAIAATADTGKTLMHFWKGYNIYHCIKNLAWAWDDVTKECMNGVWKKLLKRYVHEGFEKDSDVARITRAVVEMVNNNLNLDIDDEDIEELLDVVPEELTNEELLELEQERIAAEEARAK